jgi:crotonobetainyl-CoA:carnitine CoA-transferase CaiB-like acyl-CoA transferase
MVNVASDGKSSRSGPLAGVMVVDLTTVLMGPSATQLLADLGADVIKVETPQGDSTRKIGPCGEQNMGPIYLSTNRSKRSIVLDLKQARGRAAFLRLVEKSDVVTCNVRPEAMQRLKLTYDDLVKVNRRIIYVSMVGFSQRGRYARSPAFDDLIQAAVGLPWAVAANSDGAPRYVPVNLIDRSVGMYAFGVIATALYSREKTGVGQQIDVPMFETMVPYVLGDHLYGHKFVPAKGDFGYPRILARSRQPYRTKDAYVCCAIYHDHHWKAFLEITGWGSLWGTDPRLATMTARTEHSEELSEFVKTEIAKKTTAEWQQLLEAVDVPVFPMHSFETLLDDPHLRDIGFFTEVEHPSLGTIRETAVPSEWHGTPPSNYQAPPLLGQHSVEILSEAGFSEIEIKSLLTAGITVQA